MAGNPFRKARDNQENITASDDPVATGLFNPQEVPPRPKSTKQKKKVVIQTPPHSPEEPIRRLSLGYPSSPIQQQESLKYDPYTDLAGGFKSVDSSLDEAWESTRRSSAATAQPNSSMISNVVKAPYNPFARTLASSEDKYGTKQEQDETEQTGTRTKPAFDVDMFKNILLNGATPPTPQRRPVERGREHDDIVEATSQQAPRARTEEIGIMDTQSDFEGRFPSLDVRPRLRSPQAPRITEDNSSDDSEEHVQEQGAARSGTTGPQTVSFDDFHSMTPSTFETLTLPGVPASSFHDADTNKPLPAPPVEQKRVSIASTDSTASRTAAPPLPASRRQAHSGLTSSRRRSSSVMSRSSIQSDASSAVHQPAESNVRAPPPPPARRQPSRPVEDITSPSREKQNVPPPAPAPRRAPARTAKIEQRSPSNASRFSVQPLSETTSSHDTPPRPPPRRAESNRSSVDGSLKSAGQDSRRVSKDIARQASQVPPVADLATLQKEVDDLFAESAAG